LSKLVLSETDAQVLQLMRNADVFTDLENHRITNDEPTGSICFTCADGHQIGDIYTRHSNIYEEEACIHTFGLNGGALLLAPNSPLLPLIFPEGVHAFLIQQIDDAMKMKGINLCAIYTHFPCGAATSARLSIMDQLGLVVSAKTFLKKRFPTLKVPLFVHVHWPYRSGDSEQPPRPSMRRTYYMSGKHAEAWIVANRQLVIDYEADLRKKALASAPPPAERPSSPGVWIGTSVATR